MVAKGLSNRCVSLYSDVKLATTLLPCPEGLARRIMVTSLCCLGKVPSLTHSSSRWARQEVPAEQNIEKCIK